MIQSHEHDALCGRQLVFSESADQIKGKLISDSSLLAELNRSCLTDLWPQLFGSYYYCGKKNLEDSWSI